VAPAVLRAAEPAYRPPVPTRRVIQGLRFKFAVQGYARLHVRLA
jgi:hypothetical protein